MQPGSGEKQYSLRVRGPMDRELFERLIVAVERVATVLESQRQSNRTTERKPVRKASDEGMKRAMVAMRRAGIK